MSTASTVHADPHHAPAVNLTRFGMITFLASEVMLFGGLISAYLILWISRGAAYRPEFMREEHFTWPLLLTGINTIFLLSSSATLHIGEKALSKGKSITGWLALTTLLGAIFVSVQGYEWTHLYHEQIPVHVGDTVTYKNVWFDSGGTFTACFFTLTGFHGLHVSIGVLFLAITTLMAAAGRFTPHRHDFLMCVSLYWHFVDIVWIFLFSIMYILPFFFR